MAEGCRTVRFLIHRLPAPHTCGLLLYCYYYFLKILYIYMKLIIFLIISFSSTFQHCDVCAIICPPKRKKKKKYKLKPKEKNEAEDGIYVDTFTVMILLRHPQKNIN